MQAHCEDADLPGADRDALTRLATRMTATGIDPRPGTD